MALKGMRSILKSVSEQVLRFIFPWACAGCRRALENVEDEGFCGRCWLAIPRIDGPICRSCGIPLKDGGNVCFPCRKTPLTLMVRAAASYSPPLQPAIHRFKYTGRKSMAYPFRALIEYAWNQYPELHPVDALIPIPLHPRTRHERGFNQATLLSEGLAESMGRPVLGNILIRTRKTAPQFKLRKAERLTNLHGAFGLEQKHASIKGLHILLIDDVCTTGATLKECAKVLRQSGAASVKALVLARDI
jgi:ComF family protein